MAPSIPSLETFVGPAFVIICLAFMLYGTFCAQLYYYWSNYHDGAVLQTFVAIVGILETVHTGLCIHIFYDYLVTEWGNPLAISRIVITATIAIYFMVFIGVLVQGWYIHRIWRLRKQVVVVVPLVAAVVVDTVLSFRACVFSRKYDTWVALVTEGPFIADANANFGLNLALDTAITSTLILYLMSDLSKVVKRSTRKMIKMLINFALSTGVLIVLTHAGLIIAFNLSNKTMTWGAMLMFLAKVYANSMLAALNARRSVQAAASDTNFSVELSQLCSAVAGPLRVERPVSPLQIRVPKTTITSPEGSWVNSVYENDRPENPEKTFRRDLEEVRESIV